MLWLGIWSNYGTEFRPRTTSEAMTRTAVMLTLFNMLRTNRRGNTSADDPSSEETAMNDKQLRQNVIDELDFEPSCPRWDVSPHGVADDAIFARGGHAAGSNADEFNYRVCTSSLPGWRIA